MDVRLEKCVGRGCGSPNVNMKSGVTGFYPECDDCGRTGLCLETEADAAFNWNNFRERERE